MSNTRRDFIAASTTALGALTAVNPLEHLDAPASAETAPISVRLSDAFLALFGSHPGYREIHAKGIVTEGEFVPDSGAKMVSRAAHFSQRVPVTVRFSDFAGIPTIPSVSGPASPHGMAVKFHVNGVDTDIIGHSVDAFPGKDGETFLNFLKALTASPDSAPHPNAVERYVDLHPEAKRFVETMPPPPLSYATSAYHMINAFRFSNAENVSVAGRYHVIPEAGVVALPAAKRATVSRDYLADELRERLARGPAVFTLMLQIANPGDQTADGSQPWPANRRVQRLGAITVRNVVPDSDAAQRQLLYDPVRLIDGIGLSDDPLPAVRSATYAISYARRSRT